MKRFFVTLTLSIIIFGVLTYAMPKDFDNYVEAISSCGTVSIYCKQSELDGIDMGNGKIVQCDVEALPTIIKKCQDVDGVSVTFNGAQADVTRIARLLNLKDVFEYELDGLVVTCGKSAKVRGGVVIDGRFVNVQIAYKDGAVTVGSPLILGSY